MLGQIITSAIGLGHLASGLVLIVGVYSLKGALYLGPQGLLHQHLSKGKLLAHKALYICFDLQVQGLIASYLHQVAPILHWLVFHANSDLSCIMPLLIGANLLAHKALHSNRFKIAHIRSDEE